jgi:hypothetical protein
MPSLQERDKILKESWVDARFRVPDPHPAGEHYSVQVMGVVDDPAYRMKGDNQPFTDVVDYWPAAKKFTVTHCSRASSVEAVEDFPVMVTFWQPMLPLPW